MTCWGSRPAHRRRCGQWVTAWPARVMEIAHLFLSHACHPGRLNTQLSVRCCATTACGPRHRSAHDAPSPHIITPFLVWLRGSFSRPATNIDRNRAQRLSRLAAGIATLREAALTGASPVLDELRAVAGAGFQPRTRAYRFGTVSHVGSYTAPQRF